MTVSPAVYWPVWTTGVLAWAALTYQYIEQLRDHRDSLAADIRIFNARNGIDQSVDKEDLALDLLIPIADYNLKRCASNNGWNFPEYRDALGDNVGTPKDVWGVIFHILGVIFALSGISALLPGGFIPVDSYLIMVFLFFGLSLALFLSLYGRTFLS